MVALSIDKATNSINLFGPTKLASDKIFVAANNMVAQGETRFACVCYGNVVGSRGSVVPYFKRLSSNGSKTRPSLMNKIIQSAKDMLLTL